MKEKLKALTEAIAKVYASTLNPDALLYRRNKGLQDYDERMAILIMVVEGKPFEKSLLPGCGGSCFQPKSLSLGPANPARRRFCQAGLGIGDTRG